MFCGMNARQFQCGALLHYATKLDILFTLSRKLEKTREFDILSKMICLHLHNIYFEIGSF